MARPRFDQSQWLTHFIHDYDPDKDPNYLYRSEGVELWKPYAFDEAQDRRFAHWHDYDSESGLRPGASACEVLLKVLDDGHIRSGWAYRKQRPTIWGDHSACCFTEMPLYSLIEYADRRRRGAKLVRKYGVALLRSEVYRAGGRHVIYGLSRPAREVKVPGGWPLRLHPSCGLGPLEQYRYAHTVMGNFRGRSDWTHEREWRWADWKNGCRVPGLPIWLAEEPHQFSQVRLVVEHDEDAHRVKEKLKQLFDVGKHVRGYQFNRETLANTGIISLEQIAGVLGEKALEDIRIDDIDVTYCAGFDIPSVSPEYALRVREVVARANAAARDAAAAYRADLEQWPSGFGYLAGGSAIEISGAQSIFLQAALECGLARPRGGYGYELHAALDRVCQTDDLQESLVAANAAQAVIQMGIPEARLWVSGELE